MKKLRIQNKKLIRKIFKIENFIENGNTVVDRYNINDVMKKNLILFN